MLIGAEVRVTGPHTNVEPLAPHYPVPQPRHTIPIRDGNGDPIPDFPRGIPSLKDEDGEVSSPAGM
jgi:hypothetical protein